MDAQEKGITNQYMNNLDDYTRQQEIAKQAAIQR